MTDERILAATPEAEKVNVALYTLILEYAGGTYIRQVSAVDVSQALQHWIDDLARDLPPIAIPVEIARRFADASAEGVGCIVPIQDVQSCWYASVLVKKKLAGLNIVRTV